MADRLGKYTIAASLLTDFITNTVTKSKADGMDDFLSYADDVAGTGGYESNISYTTAGFDGWLSKGEKDNGLSFL